MNKESENIFQTCSKEFKKKHPEFKYCKECSSIMRIDFETEEYYCPICDM